jgi:inward rectifier potassium channel
MANDKAVKVQSRPGDLFQVQTVGRRWAPWEDVYHTILDLSWTAYFALIALAFVGANALFAGLYLLEPGSIANAHDTFGEAFFFSVQSLATIGYGTMAPATLYGHLLVTVEALSGLLGFALVTGATFSKFSRPTARVIFSKNVVVGERDGDRYVMFRMANYRHNQIVEAQLRVAVLQTVVTREGEQLRVPVEVPLVRDRSTFFRLSWTASHKIDEKSPFYGDDAAQRLRDKESMIFLSLTGLDDTIAQTVHARYSYSVDDIVWGARFKDVIFNEPDGSRVIDYRNFHDVIPQPFTRGVGRAGDRDASSPPASNGREEAGDGAPESPPALASS